MRFYEFFKQAFTEVLEPGKTYVDNWHVEYLCDVYQKEVERLRDDEPKENDYIINIPFRSLKSMITTVCLNAWAWGPANQPWIRFQTASYSHGLAVDHSNKTRKLINSDWYQRRWGDRFKLASTMPGRSLLKDSDTFFENNKGGFRFATSVGSTATGKGGQINIVDDPLSAEQADSAKYRDRAIKWFKETFRSRVDDFEKDVFLLIMQRLHDDDLSGYLLGSGDSKITEDSDKPLKHICIPGRASERITPSRLKKYYKNGLFFPERFSEKVLKMLEDPQTGIGELAFSGQVQQSPNKEGGNIFKKDKLQKIKREDLPRAYERVGRFWDTAYTENEKNSATANVRGFLYEGDVYVTEFKFDWVEFPAQIKWMKGANGPHYIEAKATGKSAVQTLKSNKITAVEVEVDAKDKRARGNSVAPHVEAGRVYIVEDIWDKFVNDDRQGISKYPDGPYDDLGDAFTMMLVEFLGTWKHFEAEDFDDILEDEDDLTDHVF